jgi:unsaturated rhamnogalacturonyl hydrolase
MRIFPVIPLAFGMIAFTRLAPAAPAADLAPEEVAKLGWAAVPGILDHIKAPVFPAKNFPITDYGAKADGTTDCTGAIRQAIEACNKAGGGHVVVPDGDWATGPIRLLSNVDLHLADHATLHFSTDVQKYLPLVRVRFEGVECMNFAPPIYAFEQENIGVTGKGTIDGGGQMAWTQAVGARRGAISVNLPVEERLMGPGAGLRPNFVQPYRCKNVIIEGLSIRNSPMWEINPVFCTNVIVRNLDIDSHGANNDGCDPDSCEYVLIEGCTFDTGDDCIAIKCGKDDDGRRVNRPTEFVIVRNCTMKDGHGGVTLGSECTPAIRNVFVDHCQMSSPQLNAILRFKNTPVRGGVIENVYARDVSVGSVNKKNAGFLIEYTYMNSTTGPYVPVLRNVNATNIRGADVPVLVKLTAGPTAVIENIRISDSVFAGPNPDELLQNAGRITFTNVKILPAGTPLPPTVP